MPWPANSVDLNLIENIWKSIEPKVRKDRNSSESTTSVGQQDSVVAEATKNYYQERAVDNYRCATTKHPDARSCITSFINSLSSKYLPILC